MSVRDLKKATIRKSKKTRQAIEARVRTIKDKYGPFSDEIAYGIVAHKAGVDVSTIIDDTETLASIREGIDRIALLESDDPNSKSKTIIKTETVNIGQSFSLSDPILNNQVIRDAKEMTVIYAELYVFENSVRELINRVLSKKIGQDWWETSINKNLQNKVQDRINKDINNAWHGRRGSHPIYYTDLLDLKSIILKHWQYFSSILPSQEWIKVRIDEISFSRNIIDHHNPLKKHDKQRLNLYMKDWHKQISSNKGKI